MYTQYLLSRMEKQKTEHEKKAERLQKRKEKEKKKKQVRYLMCIVDGQCLKKVIHCTVKRF